MERELADMKNKFNYAKDQLDKGRKELASKD